jgi:hypothetical protein
VRAFDQEKHAITFGRFNKSLHFSSTTIYSSCFYRYTLWLLQKCALFAICWGRGRGWVRPDRYTEDRAHSFGRCQKSPQSPCFLYPGLAPVLKSPGYILDRLKHELCAVVLDEKARAFGNTSETKQTRKCGLAGAFSGQKRALACAFWSKYD